MVNLVSPTLRDGGLQEGRLPQGFCVTVRASSQFQFLVWLVGVGFATLTPSWDMLVTGVRQ